MTVFLHALFVHRLVERVRVLAPSAELKPGATVDVVPSDSLLAQHFHDYWHKAKKIP